LTLTVTDEVASSACARHAALTDGAKLMTAKPAVRIGSVARLMLAQIAHQPPVERSEREDEEAREGM